MKLAKFAVIFAIAFLSGCASYRLDRTEQLYLAQSYLPLPVGFAPPPDIPPVARYAGTSGAGCAGPQVPPWRDADGASRAALQVMSGMTLLVTETAYRRNAADAVPIASQWSWQLPRTGVCGDDGNWSRADLLKVRHLLSAGRLQAAVETPDTDYYLQLVRGAGCPASVSGAMARPCSFSQVRTRFLEPFISSMQVSYRREGLNYEQGPWPVNGAFPMPPVSVMRIPVKGNDLGGWLSATTSIQADDFFNFALPPQLGLKDIDVGELCAELGNRRDALPVYSDAGKRASRANAGSEGHKVETVSIPVCQFNMKRLSFKPARWWPDGAPAVGSEVDLLASSDALMLFRPPAHRKMLDSSGRRLCPPGTPGDTVCPEDDRLSQGFVDFDTLIDLHVDGQREPIRVPSSMNVAEFERQYGAGTKVAAITRQAVWLPQQFLLTDLGNERPARQVLTSALVAEQGMTLRFMPERSEEWRRKSGVYIADPMKAQVILAPGDRITFER
jgi:hypothetical protein